MMRHKYLKTMVLQDYNFRITIWQARMGNSNLVWIWNYVLANLHWWIIFTIHLSHFFLKQFQLLSWTLVHFPFAWWEHGYKFLADASTHEIKFHIWKKEKYSKLLVTLERINRTSKMETLQATNIKIATSYSRIYDKHADKNCNVISTHGHFFKRL